MVTIYLQLFNLKSRAIWPILVYLLMMNEKLKTLIRLFWQGRLSTEARRELLSELTAKERELRVDMENEFGKIQDDEQLHHEDDYQLYLRKILEKAGCDDTTVQRVRPIWHKWAVAASLLLISGLGYFTWLNMRADVSTSQQQVSRDTTIIRSDGDRINRFTLKDGSEVTLFPGSSIAYDECYGLEDRRLQLNGEAKFSVSQDALLPFSVEANGYTTTVLGTSFIINARSIDRVNVKLLTGKVVVRSTPHIRYAIADQYLLPGEELAIQVDKLFLEKRFFAKETPIVKNTPTRQPPEQMEKAVPSLHFVETPLPKVLKQISASKKVRFDFHDVEIRELYFTGDFSEEDDLETILDIISMMNGLEYEKQSDNSVKFRHATVEENNKK